MAKKELTPYQQERKAQKEMKEATDLIDRRIEKKERKSIVKEISNALLDAFMDLAREGVTLTRGDAKRVYKLMENFNGTSTAMLAAIRKTAKKIEHLGWQAEDHIEARHKQSLEGQKINERINKSINRRVRKGKLVKIHSDKPGHEVFNPVCFW